MKTQINGVDLEWRIDGAKHGETVMLCHPLSVDMTIWEPQIEAFGTRYRVLRYDHRGHGGSVAATGGFDFDTLAADAAALLRELGIDKVHFVGVSMGGVIGMKIAIGHPELLSSLVLCATVSEVDQGFRDSCDARIDAARRRGIEALIEPTLKRWFTKGYFQDAPSALDKVREMMRRSSVDAYVGFCESLGELNITPQLGAIRSPTLVVAGQDDATSPISNLQLIGKAIPGAQFAIIPEAGHLPNFEQPRYFNDVVLRFLAGQT
jgi:3-oxoadipate enol-lactonase